MLRDNLADSFYRCLENPRPNRADPSLTEDLIFPFQAEPTQDFNSPTSSWSVSRCICGVFCRPCNNELLTSIVASCKAAKVKPPR